MNYLKAIQEISKIKRNRQPAVFADIANKEYYDIVLLFKGLAKKVYLDSDFDFRKIENTLSTVASQQKYSNIYGEIIKILAAYDSGSLYELDYISDYNRLKILAENATENRPTDYNIFGEQIALYPIPDDVYSLSISSFQDRHVKYVGVVDQSSASGQKKVYIAETEGFTAGDNITIEPNTPREEIGVIDTVTTDDYLTLVDNLTYTHAVSSKVDYYKYTFEYENDEPNFPEKYHDILIYGTLMMLYYDDPPALAKYKNLYEGEREQITSNARGSQENKSFFVYG